MENNNFKFDVVFKKLQDLLDESDEVLLEESSGSKLKATISEYDEIDELRRLSAEFADPPQQFYTST